jgi:hypothetical protein
MSKHEHDWYYVKDNIPYRDEYGERYIIDFYTCECGAGGRVVTPKKLYDKGYKRLGIKEYV